MIPGKPPFSAWLLDSPKIADMLPPLESIPEKRALGAPALRQAYRDNKQKRINHDQAY